MDISELGFTPVGTIVALAFFVGLLWHTAKKLDNKWIPAICGAVGIVIGVIGRNTIIGFPTADPFTAAAYGFVSGIAATGVHQIYKQLSEDVHDDLKSAGGE